jgi:hypothetical protein
MNTQEQNLASAISASFELELRKDTSADQLLDILAAHINDMIDHDFNRLVNVLYRIDVNESKLRQMLNENAHDTGRVIAGLIIERQLQKIASRESFRTNNERSIDEDEKW